MVVVPQGANAEFGRSSGGFVNVITKSGTNQLHGSVHFFGKNDALSGTARHEGVERTPDFSQGQFGFTMGGPLIQDKAFFFTAYDQQVFPRHQAKRQRSASMPGCGRSWTRNSTGR